MWKKLCLVLTGVILGAAVFIITDRTEIFSNDANMTLIAGKSYEITNSDKSNDVYISATGAKKYDYVQIDSYNEITTYGSSSSSIFVASGGKTTITVGETDMNILYSSANVSVKEISGSVIKRFTIAAGKSLEISNKNTERTYALSSESARFSSKQDCVTKDAAGNVINYAAATSFLMDVPAAGSLVITAGENDLNLYAPSRWMSSDLTVKYPNYPALFTYTVAAGKTVNIVNNNKESAYSLSSSGVRSANGSRYDYVVKDINGVVTSFGDSDLQNDVTVEAGGSTIVSAPKNGVLTLCFPYDWKAKSLTVTEQSKPALTQYTFAAGKTVEIINASKDNRYSIALGGLNRESTPKVDYVSKDGFKNVSDYGSGSVLDRITVAEGGVSLITVNGGGNLRVWFPYEWSEKNVKVVEKNTQALSYYTLAASKSLLIQNKNMYADYTVATNCTNLGYSRYDYVSKDSSSVIDYASDSKSDKLNVLSGGQTLITAGAGSNIKLWFPKEWDKDILAVSDSKNEALFYYTVNATETVELKNASGYAEFDLKIKNSSVKYDLTAKNEEGLVTVCASGQSNGSVKLPFGGSARLTAKAYPVMIMYPQEWRDSYIKAAKSGVEAVYTHVIKAGTSVSLTNGANPLNVFTNGQNIEYVTKDEAGRVLNVMPKGNYSSFKVEINGSAVITAGKAYDTKLFLPNEMIKDGSLKVAESENPAVYMQTIKPGSGLRITNGNSSQTYNIYLNFTSGRGKYDYVIRDSAGRVVEYNADSSLQSLYVPAGGSLQFTINGNDEAAICLPYEWTANNLSITAGNFSTINSYTLRAGRTVEITNLDKGYTASVGTNSAYTFGAPKFDYVYYNDESEITGYGHNNVFGDIVILSGGKTIVTASPGADLVIRYPESWSSGKITITEVSSPALTHYTTRVDGTIVISNTNTSKDFTIQTNSDNSLASPKYFRQTGNYGTFMGDKGDAVGGDIYIRYNSEVLLTVDKGADLNFWMPTEWLKHIKVR